MKVKSFWSKTSNNLLCGNCNTFIATKFWFINSLPSYSLKYLICKQCKTDNSF